MSKRLVVIIVKRNVISVDWNWFITISSKETGRNGLASILSHGCNFRR